jgi:primosomal protein N' (replication factor Y)
MPTYLEIAVNIPQVSGVFHYHLPDELEGKVHPGHLVAVPFGKQHVQGVVLRQVEFPAVEETRPVLALIDPQVALTPSQLALAEYLTESTLAPLSTSIARCCRCEPDDGCALPARDKPAGSRQL